MVQSKVMSKIVRPLFQKVNDWEIMIDNLEDGIIEVADQLKEDIELWFREGRFYPFKAKLVGQNYSDNLFYYEIAEIPDYKPKKKRKK